MVETSTNDLLLLPSTPTAGSTSSSAKTVCFTEAGVAGRQHYPPLAKSHSNQTCNAQPRKPGNLVLVDLECHSRVSKRQLKETLDKVLASERKYRLKRDYLLIPAGVVLDKALLLLTVDDTCREQMIRWAYELIAFCGFDPDTVAIMVNLTDRYVEQTGDILQDRDHYQLVVMTGLYMAVKVHERQALSSRQLAELSRGKFTHNQIEAMEVKIGARLEWRLCPPTPEQFFRLVGGLTMTVTERQLVQKKMQPSLQAAIVSCERMTMLASRLFYRTVEPVLQTVLSAPRYTQVSSEWRTLLRMVPQEIAPLPQGLWNKIVIEPDEKEDEQLL